MSGKQEKAKRRAMRREYVPVDSIQRPQDGPYDVNKEMIVQRMNMNLARTGHPLHHLTADETVVEPDPTLEDMMLHVSPDEMPPIPAASPDALPAVPVVRDWYEREPGRSWLKGWLANHSQHN